jgi:DNA repair protein RadC
MNGRVPATTSEQPRQRLAASGAGALATSELLALLIGAGRPGASAADVGRAVVTRFGQAGLARASVDDLRSVPGCGQATGARIVAALELGRRLAAAPTEEAPWIRGPADAADLLLPGMSALDQEHLRVMLLNTKNRLVAVHEVYKGSVSASLLRVGEVYREAVRRNAPAIIVAHNHPSGDPSPSPEDIQVTRRLVEAGRLLDIELLDHLIIGDGDWVSLRERGAGFGA